MAFGIQDFHCLGRDGREQPHGLPDVFTVLLARPNLLGQLPQNRLTDSLGFFTFRDAGT